MAKFILEIDIDNHGFNFGWQLEELLRKELSKKKHPWNFHTLCIRRFGQKDELAEKLATSIEDVIERAIQEHKDYDHE